MFSTFQHKVETAQLTLVCLSICIQQVQEKKGGKILDISETGTRVPLGGTFPICFHFSFPFLLLECHWYLLDLFLLLLIFIRFGVPCSLPIVFISVLFSVVKLQRSPFLVALGWPSTCSTSRELTALRLRLQRISSLFGLCLHLPLKHPLYF